MAARNAAQFVGDALCSVIRQTYSDWEIIVVDDASTDDTSLRVRDFGDERVRIMEMDHQVGPARARNAAILAAGGELVALLDADDQWLPRYLERQVALFDREQAKDSRVGLVACDAFILQDGRLRGEPYSASVDAVSEPSLDVLLQANPIFSSVLIPRRVIVDVGGFASGADLPEDHDLWIRLAELGHRIVISEEPLAVYRRHAANRSADWLSMAYSSQRTYLRALDRGNLNHTQRKTARRVLRRHRAVAYLGELLSYPRLRSAPPLVWLRAVRGGVAMLQYALTTPAKWLEWTRRLKRRDWTLWRPSR